MLVPDFVLFEKDHDCLKEGFTSANFKHSGEPLHTKLTLRLHM
jgi:hypothetical protein